MNQRICQKHKYQLMNLCFQIAYKDKCLTRKTLRRLRVLLKFEVQRDPRMPTYGYTASTTAQLISHIEYCSDRMNSGRARAILRLLDALETKRHVRSMYKRRGGSQVLVGHSGTRYNIYPELASC